MTWVASAVAVVCACCCAASTAPRPPRVQIRDLRGAPGLFIGGKPTAPMLYMCSMNAPPKPEHVRQMHAAGIEIVSFACDIGWTAEDTYDHKPFDAQVATILEGNPGAYLLLRVSVAAPAWWMDQHEDQLVRYATGVGWQPNVWGGTRQASYASVPWKRGAMLGLASLAEHALKSPYADRVIGYQIANGIYGEWHYWSATDLPDTSEPMGSAYQTYLRSKYRNSVDNLRANWRRPDAEFTTATPPTLEERLATGASLFLDPAKFQPIVDYYECLHAVAAEDIVSLCAVVKQATGNASLAGVFYGYLPDLEFEQEGGHLAFERVLADPHVDFLASPHSYDGRAPGQDAGFRAFAGSIALHGKLFFDEADDRTHLAAKWQPVRFAETAEASVPLLRREFANVLAHRCGMWWFDQDGGWFDDPLLLSEIARMKRIGDASLSLDRHGSAEIAVIADLQTFLHLAHWRTGADRISLPVIREQFRELGQIGAPFDVYLPQDLAYGLVPEHKLYVFLNTWYLPAAWTEAIAKRCQGGGKTLLWVYAPGYASDAGLSLDGMRKLTGMEIGVAPEGLDLLVKVGDAQQPLVAGLQGSAFGVGKRQVSGFFAQPDERTYWLGTIGDRCGLALRRFKDWTSIYSAAAPLPSDLLRNAARVAGVHLYADTGDIIYANSNFVAVHTRTAGVKRISLPKAATVADLFGGKIIAANAASFTVDLPEHSTALFFTGSKQEAERLLRAAR